MFTEILKIKPQLDQSDLRKMERSLSGRFTRVAKTFGRGLSKIFKGGALLGGLSLIIDRLINPLKEVQETLDRLLGVSDNLSTFASQLNTTSGNLAKLQALATSAGIDQTRLLDLLTRYQTELGRARVDPKRETPVRQFMDIADTAESFFQFVQSLQRVDNTLRNAIAERVFGQRALVETAEFFQLDFDEQFRKLGLDKMSSATLTQRIERVAELEGLDSILRAQRELREIVKAGQTITEGTIQERHRAQLFEQDRAFERIARIEDISNLNRTVESGLLQIEKGMGLLTRIISNDIVPKLAPFFKKVEDGFAELLTFISDMRRRFKFFGLGGRGE